MSVRITQLPVETSIQPDTGKVRVTQLTTETSVQPDTGRVRITQIVVETTILFTPVGAGTASQPNVCIIC